jgi:hypothetical protein
MQSCRVELDVRCRVVRVVIGPVATAMMDRGRVCNVSDELLCDAALVAVLRMSSPGPEEEEEREALLTKIFLLFLS